MKHRTLNTFAGAAVGVAALFLTHVALGQTQTSATPATAPTVVYPAGTQTYVAPTAPATVPASSAPTVTYVAPAAPVATAPTTATVPAGTTYVAPAPTTTYVAPATTVVAPAPTAAPISAAGRDYDHVRVSMSAATAEPTGDQVPTTSQKLIDGANWIRKELIRDIDIAHQDITIVPANARITLYGTVPSAAMQAKIEGIARTAGSPNLVVSELKVR